MTFDTTLLVIIAGFSITGFFTGLIQVVGSIVGIIVGAIAASRSYRSVGGFAMPLLGNNELVAAITGFVAVFTVTSKLIGLLFYFIDKAYKLAAVIPGLKGLNRLGGLVLGAVEGALFCGLVLTAITRLPFSEHTITAIQNGRVSHILLILTGWMAPLLSGLYTKAKTIVP